MDNQLLNAYLQTDYIIDDEIGLWVMNIGQKEPTLSRYLHRFDQPTAAFLTAYNPMSKRLTEAQNEQRHKQLIASLNKQNMKYLTGYGAGKDDSWPAEKSVFILNITKQQADQLALEFEQAAYVWVDEAANVRLISQQQYHQQLG
ncbi:DUF3293 domain-containing protein [Thalassotalea ponticola]|uniref:DUF3293 domain-containing protein n=1 Tax=Thalassotalea ponticola TaxID=1523392 RepID=UPI0025B386C0|nr:DUF3293 domain-containing protein [Thalassotalea ponticola]MDN3652692.1 DUF3293 domain-containing protein [Thalassotalea ponticola]